MYDRSVYTILRWLKIKLTLQRPCRLVIGRGWRSFTSVSLTKSGRERRKVKNTGMRKPSSQSFSITGENFTWLPSHESTDFHDLHPQYPPCFSINSDGTAVPVPSDTDQTAEEGCGTAADGPSWPATFNSSTTDSEESTIPKEVRAAFPLLFMSCVLSVLRLNHPV